VQALITDLDLPGMGGLELIAAIRSAEAYARSTSSTSSTSPASPAVRTRIVVCTGSPVPALDATGQAPAYDAYLVKPVALATLTDTLQRLGVARSTAAVTHTVRTQFAHSSHTVRTQFADRKPHPPCTQAPR